MKSFDLKDAQYCNATEQDLNSISLNASYDSFNDLGTDEDYKDWINSPAI